eukprot:Skav230561  [mRNA]  locus=scaffold2372:43399:46640:+ [translate_table: standard]
MAPKKRLATVQSELQKQQRLAEATGAPAAASTAPAAASTAPAAAPPAERLRTKSASKDAFVTPEKPTSPPEKASPPKPSWNNFEAIMKHYQLSEEDTKAVLLNVVGPDTNAAKWWNKYRMEERKESYHAHLNIPKEVGKFACLNAKEEPRLERPDNQLGDKTVNPSETEADTEFDPGMEDLEEELGESDPLVDPSQMETCPLNDGDEDDEVFGGVAATHGGGSDDQDSPQGGAAVASAEVAEMVAVAPEQPEPTLEPVAPTSPDDAARAHATAELQKLSDDEVARQLLRVPAPGRVRQGRQVVQAVRIDSSEKKADKPVGVDPEVKRLKSLSLGPSASEAAANADWDKMEGFVKSLSNIQHVLKDPAMRNVVGALAPGLLSMFPEELGAGSAVPDPVKDARDGLPSASKPGVTGNDRPSAIVPKAASRRVSFASGGKASGGAGSNADSKAVAGGDADAKNPLLNLQLMDLVMVLLMESIQAPIVQRMRGFPEKQDLLKQFVMCGENMKAIETSLQIQREQSGELRRNKELLTIAQMKGKGFSQCKIDTIISRHTPHPDPDCPEDPSSVRFWCTMGGSFSEAEMTRVTATATADIASSAEGLSSLVGADPTLGDGSRCANGPSLKSLVDLSDAGTPGDAAPKAKSKAKAKAKAKAVAQQQPKTPAEQRTAIRNQLKKEFSQVVTVGSELKDISDDDMEDFVAECVEAVKTARMIRAQARAICLELKKDL